MHKSFVLLAALVAVPAALHAQAPEARTGTWFGVGAGGGWSKVTCSICAADRHLGPAGSLRVGAALRPGLLLGAEADVWMRDDDDVSHVLAALTGVGMLYPRSDRGLYLKGGAGYVTYRADDDLTSNLFGLIVGAGYEFGVGERLVLTNELSLVASSFGALKDGEQTVADDVSVTLLQFGIGIRRR